MIGRPEVLVSNDLNGRHGLYPQAQTPGTFHRKLAAWTAARFGHTATLLWGRQSLNRWRLHYRHSSIRPGVIYSHSGTLRPGDRYISRPSET